MLTSLHHGILLYLSDQGLSGILISYSIYGSICHLILKAVEFTWHMIHYELYKTSRVDEV